jgi:hypothetical protein
VWPSKSLVGFGDKSRIFSDDMKNCVQQAKKSDLDFCSQIVSFELLNV